MKSRTARLSKTSPSALVTFWIMTDWIASGAVHYDRPQTPLDRLRACRGVDRTQLNELLRLRATTDPFELARIIEKEIERIAALA